MSTVGASGVPAVALLVYMSSSSSVLTVLNQVNYGSIRRARFLPLCAFNWRVPVRSQLNVGA